MNDRKREELYRTIRSIALIAPNPSEYRSDSGFNLGKFLLDYKIWRDFLNRSVVRTDRQMDEASEHTEAKS